MNYFELLNLEQEYDINLALLKKNYLSKQMEYHPDRAKDNSLKIKHIETSMLLNEAYKILGDDYLRAEYLLKSNGLNLSEEGSSPKLSTSELEEILQEYEQIEEMREIENLKEFEQQKINARAKLIVTLSEQFRAGDFAKALDIAVRLKYLTNLVGNIKLKIKNASDRD